MIGQLPGVTGPAVTPAAGNAGGGRCCRRPGEDRGCPSARLCGFLIQDKAVVVRRQEGLAHDPALLPVDDADTRAKRFARCKREHLRAQADDRPFSSPVKPCTLRWRS